MSTDSNQRELEALRQRLTEYEAAFAATAPRLAAFKQLEDLAREQKTTPEAIAAKAALDVLKDETEQAADHIRELTRERDTLQAEVSLVLIQKKTHDDRTNALRTEVDSLSAQRDGLRTERDQLRLKCDQVHAELDELTAQESDIARTQAELAIQESDLNQRQETLSLNRAEFDQEEAEVANSLSELRTQLSELMDSKQSLTTDVEALTAEVEVLTAEAAVQRAEIQAQHDESRSAENSASDPAKANTDYDFDSEVGDGDEAFDRFFEADIDHDKSRDWILK